MEAKTEVREERPVDFFSKFSTTPTQYKTLIIVLVIGAGYFLVKMLIDKFGNKDVAITPPEQNFITRACYPTEVECENSCGRQIKSPAGKYCCRSC